MKKRRKITEEQMKAIQGDRKAGLGWKATLDKYGISGSTLTRIDRLSSGTKVAAKHAYGTRRRAFMLQVDQDTYTVLNTLSAYMSEPSGVFAGRLLKEQLQEVMRRITKEI